jgi:hypothetical protein
MRSSIEDDNLAIVNFPSLHSDVVLDDATNTISAEVDSDIFVPSFAGHLTPGRVHLRNFQTYSRLVTRHKNKNKTNLKCVCG